MSGWFLSLGLSLGLTLLFELPFAFLWGLRKGDITLCILVNVLTNPIVVLCTLLYRAYVPFPDWPVVAVLELAAVVTEGLLYRDLGEHIRKPILLSVCANALSYSLGLLINHIF